MARRTERNPAVVGDDVGGKFYPIVKIDSSADGQAGAGGPVAVSQPGLAGVVITTLVPLTNANQAYPCPPVAAANRRLVKIQAWEGNTLPVFIGGAAVTARVYAAAGATTDGHMLEVPVATKQGATWGPEPNGTASIVYAVASAVGQKVIVTEICYA